MRFLADESCDAAFVRALRAAGHDVTAVADELRGADDRTVLAAAMQEGRLLLTEDKDFGELVFAAGAPTIGVILFRYAAADRWNLVRRVVDFIGTRHYELAGSFVVMSSTRTRLREIPRR